MEYLIKKAETVLLINRVLRLLEAHLPVLKRQSETEFYQNLLSDVISDVYQDTIDNIQEQLQTAIEILGG
jgi:hypothetical protein